MSYVYMDKENGIRVVQEEHTIKLGSFEGEFLKSNEVKKYLTPKEGFNLASALVLAATAVEEKKVKGKEKP